MCELINKQCIEMSKYVYSKNVFVIIIKRVCTSTAVFWICGKLSKQITHAIRSTNTLTLLTCFSNWKTIMNKRARLWMYVWVCSIYKRKRHGNKVDVCMEKYMHWTLPADSMCNLGAEAEFDLCVVWPMNKYMQKQPDRRIVWIQITEDNSFTVEMY